MSEVASHGLSVSIYSTSQLLKLFKNLHHWYEDLFATLHFFILCKASLSYSSLLLFWNYCVPDCLCFVLHYRGSYDQITVFSLCVCVCFSHNVSICKLERKERERRSSYYSNSTEQNGRDSPVGTNISWHITYPGALCDLECLYSLFLLILS